MNTYKTVDKKTVHILDEEGKLVSIIDNNPFLIRQCKEYKWEHDEKGHVISKSPNDFGTDFIYLAQLVLNFYKGTPMHPQIKMRG